MESYWKKNPALFTSGAFLLNSKGYNYNIIGWDESTHEFLVPQNSGDWIHYTDVVLLARPVHKMTTNELSQIGKNKGFADNFSYSAIHNITVPQLFYLLSIGVYPFDGSDFDNDDLDEVDNITVPTEFLMS